MYRLDCGCVTEVTNDGRWQISEAREERHEYLWNQSSFVLCHCFSQMKSSSLLSYHTMKYKFNCISLVKFINFASIGMIDYWWQMSTLMVGMVWWKYLAMVKAGLWTMAPPHLNTACPSNLNSHSSILNRNLDQKDIYDCLTVNSWYV